MDVHITKFNASNIIKEIQLTLEETEEEIYKINFRWFNKLEVQTLLSFKLLYENPALFFEKYVKKVKKDTEIYAFNNQTPSYHGDDTCQRLKSNFKNIKIPQEIIDRGEESVNAFRAWCKSNVHLLDDLKLFVEEIKSHFKLSATPQFVDFSNSGITNFENIALGELEALIEDIINQAETYYNSTSSVKEILNRFGKSSYLYRDKALLSWQNPSIAEEAVEVLKTFEQKFKVPLIFYLKEFYRIRYNPDLKFDGLLLEEIGFKPCQSCFDFEFISEYDRRAKIRELMKAADDACKKRDCHVARELCNQVLTIDENNKRAYEKKIGCFNRTDFRDVIKEAEEYLSKFEPTDKILYRLSNAYYRINNHKKALENSFKIENRSEVPFYINYIIGGCYYFTKEYELAFQFFNIYIAEKDDITFGEICYFLAVRYYKGSNHSLAAKYFERALTAYRIKSANDINSMENYIKICMERTTDSLL